LLLYEKQNCNEHIGKSIVYGRYSDGMQAELNTTIMRDDDYFELIMNIVISRIFIATNNSIFYSADYKNWKKIRIPYDLLSTIFSLCYSSDKNKFVAVGAPLRGKSNNIIYSTSGTIWKNAETVGYNPGIILCAFYSEKIQKFIIGGYGYLGISDNAINWNHIRLDGDDSTLINDNFDPKTWSGICGTFFDICAICESSDIIIAIGGNRQSCNIIWSINGLQWNVAKISDDTRILSDVYKPVNCYPSCICYSSSLNLFIVGVEFSDGIVPDKLFLFSNDGKVWKDSKEYSKVLYDGNGTGITWDYSPAEAIVRVNGLVSIIAIMSVYSICWSPLLNLFVASVKCAAEVESDRLIGKTQIILYCLIYSNNGINWKVTDLQFQNIIIYSIYWDSTYSRFVGTGDKSSVVYSSDAKVWTYTQFELGNQNQTGIVVSGF